MRPYTSYLRIATIASWPETGPRLQMHASANLLLPCPPSSRPSNSPQSRSYSSCTGTNTEPSIAGLARDGGRVLPRISVHSAHLPLSRLSLPRPVVCLAAWRPTCEKAHTHPTHPRATCTNIACRECAHPVFHLHRASIDHDPAGLPTHVHQCESSIAPQPMAARSMTAAACV